MAVLDFVKGLRAFGRKGIEAWLIVLRPLLLQAGVYHRGLLRYGDTQFGQTTGQVGMPLQRGVFMIIEPGAAQAFVVQLEP